jgi:hypothetical protein
MISKMLVKRFEEIERKKTLPAAHALTLANAFSFCMRKYTKAGHASICKCPLPASTPTLYNTPA